MEEHENSAGRKNDRKKQFHKAKRPAPENRRQDVLNPDQFIVGTDIDGKNIIQPFTEAGIPVGHRNVETISGEKLDEFLFIHQDRFVDIFVRIISNDYRRTAFCHKEIQDVSPVIHCFKDLPERIYSGQGNDRGMEHMVCEQGFFLTLRYVADRVVVARGDGIQAWMASGTAAVFKSVHEMDSVRGSFIKGRKIVVFVLFLSVFVHFRVIKP